MHFPWFLSGIVAIYQYLLNARHCSEHFDSKVSFNQNCLKFIDGTAEGQGVMQVANSYTANKQHSQDLNPGLSESRVCGFSNSSKGFHSIDLIQGRQCNGHFGAYGS